jgi:RecA/RadA recombinase
MVDGYTFDETIQLKILSILRENLLTADHVQPQFFDNPVLASFCKALSDIQAKTSGSSVDLTLFEVRRDQGEFAKDYEEDIQEYAKHIFTDVEESQIDYIKDIALKFAKWSLFKQAYLDSYTDLQRNDMSALDRLETRWKKVVNTTFEPEEDTGKLYFSDYQARIKQRMERPEILKTLIPELDRVLDGGGFGRGELNLIAGGPGSGKSFFLTHLARAAVIQRKKVVFYSCEMSYEKLCVRLDSSFAALTAHELRNNIEQVSNKLEKAHRHFGDRLLIKKFYSGKTKVSMIERHLDQLQRGGFIPDVILVDYVNLLSAEIPTGSRHEDLDKVYIDLRGLIQERNLFNATGAQGNRESIKVEVTGMAELAHAFSGAAHADTIITTNMTAGEQQRQSMRLFIPKNRYDIGSTIIPISTDFAHGNLYRRQRN